jgi:hypothetical protein
MRAIAIGCVTALLALPAMGQQPGYYYPPPTTLNPYGQTVTGTANNSGVYITSPPAAQPAPYQTQPLFSPGSNVTGRPSSHGR